VADEICLVNGLPGVGKSNVAAMLAAAVGAHLVSKDAIKERLAMEPALVESSRLGILAAEQMWADAAAIRGLVLVDCWLFRPRDLHFAASGLQRSGAGRAVELWCHAPIDTVRDRYERRRRGAVHADPHRLATDWETWASHAEPLALTPVIPIDTSTTVRVDQLVSGVVAALPTSSMVRPPSTD
jgi:predicted kinase